MCSTEPQEAVGQHQQVSVPSGICDVPEFAVSKTKILLGVPEERFHAPSTAYNSMSCSGVYVRSTHPRSIQSVHPLRRSVCGMDTRKSTTSFLT